MVIETQYGFLVLKVLNNSQLQRRVRTHDEPLSLRGRLVRVVSRTSR